MPPPKKKDKTYPKEPQVQKKMLKRRTRGFTPKASTRSARAISPSYRLDINRQSGRVLQPSHTPRALVVNKQLDIVRFRGRGLHLHHVPGVASLRLRDWTPQGLFRRLKRAIQQVRQESWTVAGAFRGTSGEEVHFQVRPIKRRSSSERHFLIVFADKTMGATSETLALRKELDRCQIELRRIKQQFEASGGELRVANEEPQTSNEELRVTNEELDTAKQELEASNNELSALNKELQNQNLRITAANNDLRNVFNNVALPMLILGGDLRIRHFTSSAGRAFHLLPGEVGRPITHLRAARDFPSLQALVSECIASMSLKEQQVKDREGRWQSLRIRPYTTADQRVDGAVVTLVDIDQVKSEAAESRLYAQAIVESVENAILVLDPDLRVKTANHAFFEIFQVTSEQTENRLVNELGNGQWNIPPLIELLKNILPKRNQFSDFEVERDFPGIGRRTLVLNARPVRHEGGLPLILLAIDDVTERKRTTQLLGRQSRLLELAHDAVIVRDAESRVIFWNRGAERMYGWTKEEALGKVTHTFLKTEFPEPFEEVERKLRTTGAWEGELSHTTRSGKQIVVAGRQVFRRDEYGLAFDVLEINRDVTEQKRAQEAQRASEERFRLLVDQVRDYAIFMLDTEGYVQTWNAGAERIKGYRAAEIIGKHFSCFYPGKDIQAGQPAEVLKVAGQEGRFAGEGWRVRKDGSNFWANVVVTALHDSSGNLRGFAKVVRDMTEQKRAQESLSQLSGRLLKLQDEERRRIARELHDSTSQTLSALALNLSLLQQMSQLDSEALKRVSEAVHLANQAANEIRNVSHLLYPPDLDEVGLTAAIRWHVRKFTERTGLRVDVELPPRFQRLSSDQDLALFRVVQESLMNVHRHSGSPAARVQLTLHRGNIALQIEDTGEGMPAGTLDFDDGHCEVGDVGVGIRGMRERMKQLGGELTIRSNHSGTCVTAILPVEKINQERTFTARVEDETRLTVHSLEAQEELQGLSEAGDKPPVVKA